MRFALSILYSVVLVVVLSSCGTPRSYQPVAALPQPTAAIPQVALGGSDIVLSMRMPGKIYAVALEV